MLRGGLRKAIAVAAAAWLLAGASGCGGRTAADWTDAVPGGPALALPPERTSRQVVVSRLGAEHNGRSAGAQVTGSGMVLDAGNSAEFALYSFNPAKSVTTLAIDVFSIAEPRYWVGLADYSRQRWDFSGPYSASAELGVELRHASPHGNINVVIIAPPGGQVEIASLAVSDAAPDNQPPHAVLAAPDADGPYPLSITLDGSLSSDLDGSIASYAWDLDGDGSFETDTGSVPQAQLAIPGPGSYRPGLRVADNLGATDIAEASSVTAHGWASQVLAAAGDSGRSSSLAAVNGRPAVTYRQVDGTGEHLNYAISSTLLGLAAGDWQTITLRSAPGAGLSSSLLEVDGAAAVAFCADSPLHLHYARAGGGSGASLSDWTILQASPFPNVGNYNSLALIDGNPAISYYCGNTTNVWYIRSSTAQGMSGAAWSAPVSVDGDGPGVDMGYETSLAEVAGRPAIAYRSASDGDQLRYARSSTVHGTGSGDWLQKFTLDSAASFAPSLCVVAGCPAIAYWSAAGDDLRYAWAATADGGAPGNWTTLSFNSNGTSMGACPSLGVSHGRPAIAHLSSVSGLRFSQSTTADGQALADWPAYGDSVDAGAAPTAECSLALLFGRPCVSYYNAASQDLMYAVLF